MAYKTEVHFTPTANGYAELSAESAKKVYIVRFYSDARVEFPEHWTLQKNFRQSSVGRAVLAAFFATKDLIGQYLNATSESDSRRLYWEIREALRITEIAGQGAE